MRKWSAVNERRKKKKKKNKTDVCYSRNVHKFISPWKPFIGPESFFFSIDIKVSNEVLYGTLNNVFFKKKKTKTDVCYSRNVHKFISPQKPFIGPESFFSSIDIKVSNEVLYGTLNNVFFKKKNKKKKRMCVTPAMFISSFLHRSRSLVQKAFFPL